MATVTVKVCDGMSVIVPGVEDNVGEFLSQREQNRLSDVLAECRYKLIAHRILKEHTKIKAYRLELNYRLRRCICLPNP
jgi:hypothetical protein